eukprot:6219387-Prorocentrum_lima.AAC.1
MEGRREHRLSLASRTEKIEITFLNLLVGSVFGTAYDAPLKLSVKLNKTVADAVSTNGIHE